MQDHGTWTLNALSLHAEIKPFYKTAPPVFLWPGMQGGMVQGGSALYCPYEAGLTPSGPQLGLAAVDALPTAWSAASSWQPAVRSVPSGG